MEVTPDAPAQAYFDIMTDCEDMAIEILGFLDGQRRYPGGVRDAMAFSPGLYWKFCYPTLLRKRKL
jgi:hypothetical protein